MSRAADLAEAGFITTLVRGDELLSVHVTGERREALRQLAERCDREGWRVKTVSTPETIVRDLQGPRRHSRSTRPERILLGMIGRLDLDAEASR